MQAVILAGGLATRLKPLTTNVPKSMVKIIGKPFLEYQLELLKKNEIRDIILCVGYLHEQIEDYFGNGRKFDVNIVYSQEKVRLLGTGGALKNAEKYLESKFFVMYGDSYLPIAFRKVYQHFINNSAIACMVVYKNESRYDKSNVLFKNKKVKVYDKGKPSPEMRHIDYGLTIFSKETLKEIPKEQPCDLGCVLSKLAKDGKLLGCEVYNRFYEIGSLKGLRDFEKYISEVVK
jgi:MurNAc alpha-1-phosphate uridylyltransferase